MRSVGDIEKNRLRSVDDKPRVCVRDVRHLLWYTKRWFHKMITRRYYKLFMLNKFAASSTLNNCLAKINIRGLSKKFVEFVNKSKSTSVVAFKLSHV